MKSQTAGKIKTKREGKNNNELSSFRKETTYLPTKAETREVGIDLQLENKQNLLTLRKICTKVVPFNVTEYLKLLV